MNALVVLSMYDTDHKHIIHPNFLLEVEAS